MTALVLGGIVVAAIVWRFKAGVDASPGGDPAAALSSDISRPGQNLASARQTGSLSSSEILAYSIQEILQTIHNEQDPMQRERIVQDWLNSIPIADIPECLKTLAPSTHPAARELLARLARKWAESDPKSAARFGLPPGESQNLYLATVGSVWASTNLTEAIDWVHQLPPGPDQQAAALAVAAEGLRSDPLEALRLMVTLPSSDARDELIARSCAQLASANPDTSIAWAKSIPDNSLRELVISEMATAMGESDPVAAAQLALQSLPPGKAQDDAVVGIVQRWVQNDASAAANWVSQFPSGQLRDYAQENLVKLWADQDLTAAGKWAENLSDSGERDKALGEYIGQITVQQPQTAVLWIDKIQDAELKDRTRLQLAQTWLSIDSPAAQTWIQSASFPASLRAQLSSQASPTP